MLNLFKTLSNFWISWFQVTTVRCLYCWALIELWTGCSLWMLQSIEELVSVYIDTAVIERATEETANTTRERRFASQWCELRQNCMVINMLVAHSLETGPHMWRNISTYYKLQHNMKTNIKMNETFLTGLWFDDDDVHNYMKWTWGCSGERVSLEYV